MRAAQPRPTRQAPGPVPRPRSPHQPGLVGSPAPGGSYLSGDLPGQHSLGSVPASEMLTLLPGFLGSSRAGRGAHSHPRFLALSCLEALDPQAVPAVCDRWTGPSEGQGLGQAPAAWHRLVATGQYASVVGGRTHSDRSLHPPHSLRNTVWRCKSWEAQGFWDSFFLKIILFIYFWLCSFFFAAQAFSPVAASGGSSLAVVRRLCVAMASLVAEQEF